MNTDHTNNKENDQPPHQKNPKEFDDDEIDSGNSGEESPKKNISNTQQNSNNKNDSDSSEVAAVNSDLEEDEIPNNNSPKIETPTPQNNNELNKYEEEKLKTEKIEKDLLNSIQNKENASREKIILADSINFKSIPDKIISTDEYGFVIENNNNNEDQNNQKTLSNKKLNKDDLLQINARMEKWAFMLQHYEEFSKKKFEKLKSRTRKGVPDNFRSAVWQKFAEKEKFFIKNKFQELDNEKIDEDTEIVIIKDLDRTFPACQFFKEKYGNGQRKLYKVLSNYSKFNTNTGYVQGMGFIVAVFLTYMDEESSFYMLHSLMKKYNMEGFYLPDFPELKKTFYTFLNLLKKFLPKLYELFKKEGMMPSMYASEWFICLFSRNLDFKVLVRIFDVFLLEGYKVIYRFTLAFLKMKEEKFLAGKNGLASIMETINSCCVDVNIDELFKIAFDFSLSRKFIEKCGEEYEKVKNNSKNEFVAQL